MHRTSTKKMKVKMVDGLPAVLTCVHNNAITIAQTLVAGDLRCCPKQVPEKGALALIGFDKGRNVLAGNDQDVYRSLGVDVGKGVGQRILEEGCGRNLTFDNLAE